MTRTLWVHLYIKGSDFFACQSHHPGNHTAASEAFDDIIHLSRERRRIVEPELQPAATNPQIYTSKCAYLQTELSQSTIKLHILAHTNQIQTHHTSLGEVDAHSRSDEQHHSHQLLIKKASFAGPSVRKAQPDISYIQTEPW